MDLPLKTASVPPLIKASEKSQFFVFLLWLKIEGAEHPGVPTGLGPKNESQM